MTHGPEHHIEEAEHAAHAVHDDFNKRVTMSIAIVAAILAAVTMVGHRAHNETLILQGEALQLQGEALQLQNDAGRESTNAAKHWQYYQTKNLFHLESNIVVDLLSVLSTDPKAQNELAKVRADYKKNVDKYDKKLPDMVKEGHEIEKKAEEKMKEAGAKLIESQKKMTESHLVHAKTNRFDLGELGLQFGVVLCSLGILTKGRGFWFAGLASSGVGLAVALTGQFGLFLGHH